MNGSAYATQALDHAFPCRRIQHQWICLHRFNWTTVAHLSLAHPVATSIAFSGFVYNANSIEPSLAVCLYQKARMNRIQRFHYIIVTCPLSTVRVLVAHYTTRKPHDSSSSQASNMSTRASAYKGQIARLSLVIRQHYKHQRSCF